MLFLGTVAGWGVVRLWQFLELFRMWLLLKRLRRRMLLRPENGGLTNEVLRDQLRPTCLSVTVPRGCPRLTNEVLRDQLRPNRPLTKSPPDIVSPMRSFGTN